MGKGELKEHFSISRVELPWIELYANPARFYARSGRATVVRVMHPLAATALGKDAWDKRVKPFAEKAAFTVQRMREMDVRCVVSLKLFEKLYAPLTSGILPDISCA